MRTLFAPTKVEELREPIQGTVEQTITRNQPGRTSQVSCYLLARSILSSRLPSNCYLQSTSQHRWYSRNHLACSSGGR